MIETREVYLEKFKNKLDAMNDQIDTLVEKKDKLGDDAKKVYHEKVELLKATRRELEKQLTEARESSGEAWRDLRFGLDGAVSAFGGALKSALSRFTKQGPETLSDDEALADRDHPSAIAEDKARTAKAAPQASAAGN